MNVLFFSTIEKWAHPNLPREEGRHRCFCWPIRRQLSVHHCGKIGGVLNIVICHITDFERSNLANSKSAML
jgi:hypothetical protein